MVAPQYLEDLTDLTLAENLTPDTWAALGGGGAGLAADPDFAIQGTNCVTKQVNNTRKGMAFDEGVTVSLGTGVHVFVWVYCTTPGLLAVLSTGGINITIGDGTSARVEFHVAGAAEYALGGWLNVPIKYVVTADTEAPFRTLIGSPSGNPQFFGLMVETVATIMDVNIGCDAIRYGTGAYLRDGVVGDPCTFSGFATQNDAVANRWGILTAVESGYALQGRFVIGQTTAKAAVDAFFADSNTVVSLVDTPHTEGDFTQIIVDGSTSNFNLTNVTILGLGANNPGRLVFNNASTTSALTGCTFQDMGFFVFRGGVTALNCTWRGCVNIVQNGAVLDGAVVSLDKTDNDFGAVKVFDFSGSTFEDETTDANSATAADFLPMPSAGSGTDDYVAFGFSRRFSQITLDNAGGTAGTVGVIAWEYWNGAAWVALSGVTDGTTSFTATVADGQVVSFTEPVDWMPRVLDSSAQLFYIRGRATTAFTIEPVYDQGFIDQLHVSFITADDLTDIKNCDFTFNTGGGHAIEITATGTYTFDGNVFTGYGADGTDTSAIVNTSGDLVTINVTNASSPTITNVGASTSQINNNITGTITVQDEAGVAIAGAEVSVRKVSDNTEVFGGTTNGSGVVTAGIPASGGAVVTRVRKGSGGGTDYIPISAPGTIGAGDFTVLITMVEDVNNAT